MKDQNGKVVRKVLPKKEILKLKPGALLRICWLDGKDSVHLLLEKPSREPGEVSLNTWTRDEEGYDRRFVNSSQVVAVVGEVEFEVNEVTQNMHVFTSHGEQVISLN